VLSFYYYLAYLSTPQAAYLLHSIIHYNQTTKRTKHIKSKQRYHKNISYRPTRNCKLFTVTQYLLLKQLMTLCTWSTGWPKNWHIFSYALTSSNTCI